MSISKNLEPRIAELEMKLTFQETIIDKMQVQLRYLVNKLKDVQPSNIATQAEETPPPHY